LRSEIQENAAMKKRWSFWKGVGLMFKFLGLVVIVALLAPIGYFAWRAGQPLSMPEYGGRTFYQLLSERQQAYADLAHSYQTSHPNVDVKSGACFFTEILVEAMEIPMAGRYALSAIYPGMLHSIDPRDIRNGYIPTNVTWANILPTSWNVFERFVWGTISHAPNGPEPYCRISAP
jgi:hypothetical protein